MLSISQTVAKSMFKSYLREQARERIGFWQCWEHDTDLGTHRMNLDDDDFPLYYPQVMVCVTKQENKYVMNVSMYMDKPEDGATFDEQEHQLTVIDANDPRVRCSGGDIREIALHLCHFFSDDIINMVVDYCEPYLLKRSYGDDLE